MPRKAAKSWSMYPALHDQLSNELQEDDLHFSFHDKDDESSCIETYDTNIMGRFSCYNPKCPKRGWSSKKIAITIRMYTNDRYNVRVYHQRCKQCNALSRPSLNAETYVDRVSYRLKKWCDIEVEQPYYGGESEKPHEEHLCEGCKNGHCKRGGRGNWL